MGIHETRELKISERIFSLEDIYRLAKLLENEKRLATDNSFTEVTFSASCTDNSSFSSGDLAIFDKDSLLSRKRVKRIELEFRHFERIETKARIAIRINHGNDSWRNDVSVSGTDSAWVNGTLKTIEETIESFRPQNTFLYENKNLIRLIFSLGLGSLYIWAILLIPTTPSPNKPEWEAKLGNVLSAIPAGTFFFRYFIAFLVGWLPSDLLYHRLKSWWPSIELQIGPEHMLIEKQRRKWIITSFALGVLPLLTSLIYDLLKMFFNHG